MKLPIIPQDKANHFIYGCVIYFLSSLFFAPIVSLIITIFIAVSKEVYDKVSKKGTSEILDALVTILGGLLIFSTNIK